MSIYEDKPKGPGMWQPRVKAYLWFGFMGLVLFVAFTAIRASIPTPQWNVLSKAEWGMTFVWLLVVACTFVFAKIYFWFNPEADQSLANMVRLNYRELGNLKQELRQQTVTLQGAVDMLETYVVELPTVKVKK